MRSIKEELMNTLLGVILITPTILMGENATMHSLTRNLEGITRGGAELIAESYDGFVDTTRADENGWAYSDINISTVGINNIKLPQTNHQATIKLYNILGQELNTEKRTLTTGTNNLQLPTNLTDGMYIAKITTDQGTITKKLTYIKNNGPFQQLQINYNPEEPTKEQEIQNRLGKDLRETNINIQINPTEESREFIPYTESFNRPDSIDFNKIFLVNDVPKIIGAVNDSIITENYTHNVENIIDNDNGNIFELNTTNGGTINNDGTISWFPTTDGEETTIEVIVKDALNPSYADTSVAFTLTYEAPIVWSEVSFEGLAQIPPQNFIAIYANFKYICQDDTTIQQTATSEGNGEYNITNLPYISGVGSTYKLEITPTGQSSPQFIPATIYHNINENTIGFIDNVYALTHNRDATFTIRDLDDTSRVAGLTAQIRDAEENIVQTTTTDEEGQATFDDLETGTYHVEIGGDENYLARRTAFNITNRTTHADSTYLGPHNYTLIKKDRPIPGTLDETVEMSAAELKEGMMINPPTDGNVYLPLAQNEIRYLRLDSFTPQDSLYFITYLAEGDSLFGINSDQWVYVNEFPEGEDGIDINTFGDNDTERRYGYGGVVGATINMAGIHSNKRALFKEIYGRALMGLTNNVTTRTGVFNANAQEPVPKDQVQLNTRTTYLQLKYDPANTTNPLEEGYYSDFMEELTE